MTNAVSVKDRLKKHAIEAGKTMQDILATFGLERTVYRISLSPYAEHFILKGGIFLYALFEGKYVRATMDIDLLAQHMPNDSSKLKNIFKDIFSIECDDALRFDIETLRVIDITEFKEYHGVNVSIMGYLDRTKVPVSIDIGFGDVIYPEKIKMDFPVLLDMEVPEVYVYSIYSVIAEKFEAFVSLGLANSRYKDFYDIYILAEEYVLEGTKLKNAIIETFSHRGTGFDDIIAFEPDFIENPIHQSRWKTFIKKKKALVQVDLNKTILLVKALLLPITEAIKNNSAFDKKWNIKLKEWT